MNYKFHDSIVYRLPAYSLKDKFTHEEIQTFFQQPENLEALFLASPILYAEFNKIRAGKEVKDEAKVFNSLLKYLLRMHSRCTPFGLFAACGIAQWGNNSGEMIVPTTYNRSTRLDMHFTVSLAMELAKQQDVKPFIKFYPNTSCYESGDKLRYVEYSYKDKQRVHQISSVDNSEYLRIILNEAKKGKTIDELVASITNNEVSIDEATVFVDQILESQILVSELEPGVTGDELTTEIVKTLSEIQAKNPSFSLKQKIEILNKVLSKIDQVDQKIVNEIEAYHEISLLLKETGVDFDLSKLFQTDLFFVSAAEGPRQAVKGKLLKTMALLRRLNRKPSETNLSQFMNKFHQRYEENEVPLLVALDSEMGIGYANNLGVTSDVSPLLEALAIPYKEGERKIVWDEIQTFLLLKISEAQRTKARVVQLRKNELEKFEVPNDKLPLSLSVMFSVLGEESGAEKIYFGGASGTSAANLLGRFASGNDCIKSLVEDIVEEEIKLVDESILAEIVHLPENRVGNILMRPSFRTFEIPYLSKSKLPKENQIELEDLMVSVKWGRKLVLRSKRLNKEILPRMANAHNFSYNSLPVYQFLCDLQGNDTIGGVYFTWGTLQSHFPFLPRVEVEGVIVSLAIWQLKKERFKVLTELSGDNVQLKVNLWREKNEIDPVVMLVEGDNKLLVNFNDPNNVNMFLVEIKNKNNIILEEFPYGQGVPFVKGRNGDGFANEFVAPIILEKKDEKSIELENNRPVKKELVQRSYSIGSEWLYYKLYCGVKTSDEVLSEAIMPFVTHLKDEKIIDKWFFIRYNDPDLHLRIRFHFVNMDRIGEAIQLFQTVIADYVNNGLIWKVQADTYQRELERYGANTIALSEELFHIDSDAVCQMLNLIDGDEGEQVRWQFGMRALDQLFDDFSYSLDDRLELMRILKTSFAKEFNSDKYLNKQIDKKYRENRELILSVLNRNNDANSEIKPLFDILEKKTKRSQKCIKDILSRNENNLLEMMLDDIMSSYIHMLFNRIFRNNQRQHELVVYDFMWRWYRTKKAVAKQGAVS